MVVSPLDAEIVYFSTSVADFVLFVEVCRRVASMLLDSLTGRNLGLDFTSSNGVITCVKLIKLFVNAL